MDSVHDHTRTDIKPGLIGLDMDMMLALDTHVFQGVIKNIRKRLDEEHPIVHNALHNLIAVLQMKIPRGFREAREILENLAINQEQKGVNLNALADLEHLYRELRRTKDADKCRLKIDAVLNGNSDSDTRCLQMCLFEQAYAMQVERTNMNQSTLEKRIVDLTKVLQAEKKRSVGSSRKMFDQSIHYQKQIHRNVQNANDAEKTDGNLLRKDSILQKFDIAFSMMTPPSNENIVWVYYHAKAFNQYYDSMSKNRGNDDVADEKMADVTRCAIEKFWQVSKYKFHTDNALKQIVARSFAYLGHIFTNRRQLILDHIASFRIPDKIILDKMLRDPIQVSNRAYGICNRDAVVIARYGRCLLNEMKNKDKSITERKHGLEYADKILSTCLENEDHWFSRSTRMSVKFNLFSIEMKNENQSLALELLNAARSDGVECFNGHCTQADMVILADICQKLSKFPSTNKYGPEFVKNKPYLHEALDFLNYGMGLGQRLNFHWFHRMASCLFDLGEVKEAVECQEKAMLLSNNSSTEAFFVFCVFILKFISIESDARLYKHFLYVLTWGKSKYGVQFDDVMNKIMRRDADVIINVLDQTITKNLLVLNGNEKHILQICIAIWQKMSKKARLYKLRSVETLLSQMKTDEINEKPYELSELFTKPSLEPACGELKSYTADHTYDFFISHSNKDSDWVNYMLMPLLERKIDDQDIALKGCQADRDFVPGKNILSNIVDSISNSYKVILVLSEHFITSNWCEFEAEQAIMKGLNLISDADDSGNSDTVSSNCVIPIRIDSSTIPTKLSHINYVDMTNESNFVVELRRLKDHWFV